MSYPVTKAAVGIYPQSGIEKLRGSGRGGLASEKQRLRRAAAEFESLFMYEMLKTMRRTIPKSDLSQQGALSGDLGKETFTQLFDMELARKMAGSGHNSIAQMLYHSMERVLERQHGQEPEATIKPLRAPPRAIPLGRRRPDIPLPTAAPISISRHQPVALPPRTAVPRDRPDTVMARYGSFINEAASETSLDSALICAVIETESSGNPRAVSHAGAKGLMQLVDSTIQDYSVTRPFDPRENILAGSRYLKRLLDRFGDLKLALAAYNAGPGRVQHYQGVPPFKETIEYVDRVMNRLALRHRAVSNEAKDSMTTIR